MPGELSRIAPVTASIAASTLPRRRARLTSDLTLSLSQAIPLLEGLGGETRAVLVRQLLGSLGFDERRHLPWRLEHKLVQALVLHAYIPEAIPVTCGLNTFLAIEPAGSLPNPAYFVKRALVDSSGESANLAEVVPAVLRLQPRPWTLLEEEYIVQERIPIACEYRVHSLEDAVIEDLTFHRYRDGSIPGERDAPNAFVQALLDRLPDAILGGSLLACDVARTSDGSFVLVEVNFSGFHPVFKRGFHCSGYFHDYFSGACDTARLLNYVACADGVQILVRADAPGHPVENRFYADTAECQRRLGTIRTVME
ncbi:MAG TPA: hypothetical protein VHU83_05995 [Bryobacteraceae bacterium]|nr:hypothetical protein [Bryobacteraceae bacterium]